MTRLLKNLCLGLSLLGLAAAGAAETRKATFAGGCFWCMEPPYDKLDGVISTISGYAGGELKEPTYEQVSSGQTDHQEVVQVTYDDEKVSYAELLEVFWRNVDPFDDSGQFCDKGSQYLSGIFYHDDRQKALAEASKRQVANRLDAEQPIVTFIEPVKNFHPAEAYHQNYYQEHSIRYNFYRSGCGRDARLQEVWGRGDS